MNSRRIFSLVLLVSLVSLSAFAAPPMKSPKLAELEYFVGNWDCKGTSFAMQDNPEHSTMGKAKGWWTLDGQWLAISYDETKDAKNPHPVSARMFLGYDWQLKQIVSGGLDNMGGYATSSSDGWKNNELTLDGPMHTGGMTVKNRDVFTKKSATELMHASYIEMNGKWQKLDEETCWKK